MQFIVLNVVKRQFTDKYMNTALSSQDKEMLFFFKFEKKDFLNILAQFDLL